jgi:hypothetical protein
MMLADVAIVVMVKLVRLMNDTGFFAWAKTGLCGLLTMPRLTLGSGPEPE